MTAETDVRALYAALIGAWNRRDAAGMAECFADAGQMVGFDGSQVDGRAEIAAHLAPIFRDHPTPAFVTRIRSVRLPAEDVAVLRAEVGMAPSGQTELSPALNAVQSLVAVRRPNGWRVELFQNTPAAFHGRPEAAEAFTAGLRAVLAAQA